MINILGIGVVGTYGRGLDSLEAVLQNERFVEPDFIDVHGLTSKVPVYSVKKEDLKDKTLSRKMRRADRFSKMAVIAASDALKDSELSSGDGNCDNSSVGVILSTGFGPHATTFDFLDGYLDYGEAAVSPTSFSHSVHNAAASYISSLLGIRGPTHTVTDFDLPFQNAFLVADSWLNEGRCEYVLLGSVDELGKEMEYVFNRIYSCNVTDNTSGNIVESSVIPGEGAVFFLLSKGNIKNSYCNVSSSLCSLECENEKIDIRIMDSSLMKENFECTNNFTALEKKSFTADYRSFLGDMKITTAFNVAIGALILKNQCFYSSQDKIETIIKTIACSKYSTTSNSVSEIFLNID